MKKIITIIICLITTVISNAQEYTLTNGAYDNKTIEQYESISTEALYVKALEVLSDWSGSQKQSKINIDVQDKEQGLIIYKGSLYLGFYKTNILAGWNVYADFTIKIKCKDEKAQISCHIPTLTFDWSAKQYPATTTVPLEEIYPEYIHKSKYKIKKAAIEYTSKIPSVFDKVIVYLAEKLKTQNDDDF